MGTRMGAGRRGLAWAMVVGLALGGAVPARARADADADGTGIACPAVDEAAGQTEAGEVGGAPTDDLGRQEPGSDGEEPSCDPGDEPSADSDAEETCEEATDEVAEEIAVEEVEVPCEVVDEAAGEGSTSSDGLHDAGEPACSDGVVVFLEQGRAECAAGDAESERDEADAALVERDGSQGEHGREAVSGQTRGVATVRDGEVVAALACAASDIAASVDEGDGDVLREHAGADVSDGAASAGPCDVAEALRAASEDDVSPARRLATRAESDGLPSRDVRGDAHADVHADAWDGASQAARHGWRVSFEANCAPEEVTGTMDDIVARAGAVVRVPACGFERKGRAFVCWCTEREGAGRRLAPGDELDEEMPISSHVTLYALWEAPQVRVVVPQRIGLAPAGASTLAGPVAEAAVSNASEVSVVLEEVGISGAGWELVGSGEVREPGEVALTLALGKGPKRDLADATGSWGRMDAGDQLEVRALTMEVDEACASVGELPSLTFRIATCAE